MAEAAQAGLLRIDKATGEVTLLRPLLGATNGAAHFERAAHKIRQYWRRGVLPEAAIWAS